jgi:hypothetical protein
MRADGYLTRSGPCQLLKIIEPVRAHLEDKLCNLLCQQAMVVLVAAPTPKKGYGASCRWSTRFPVQASSRLFILQRLYGIEHRGGSRW